VNHTSGAPEDNPDVHLQRLLPPQESELPLTRLIRDIKELINPPKLPPLEVTSKPVDPKELQGIVGLYGGNQFKSVLGGVGIEILVVAIIVFLGTLKPVQMAVKEAITIMAPPPLKPVKPDKGGGGGGARQPEVKKADLPKPVKNFTPPAIPVESKLPMAPSLIADLPDTVSNNIGDLKGLNINMAGSGAGGGIGTGYGGGIGPGRGNGVGPGSGGGFGGGAMRPGNGVSQPILKKKVEPQYSEDARKAKWQGTVTLSLVVDVTGKPVEIKVIKPLGLGLDQKAIEAVEQWLFEPGKKDGKPVPVMANVEVNFRLL
jgi:TonB family protein